MILYTNRPRTLLRTLCPFPRPGMLEGITLCPSGQRGSPCSLHITPDSPIRLTRELRPREVQSHVRPDQLLRCGSQHTFLRALGIGKDWRIPGRLEVQSNHLAQCLSPSDVTLGYFSVHSLLPVR